MGDVTRHFGISSVKSIIMLSAEYRGTPYNGPYRGGGYLFNTGRLRPKGIPYSGFRLAIAVVEVYKRRVGKFVLSVCIKAGLTDAFYGYEKVKKNLVI